MRSTATRSRRRAGGRLEEGVGAAVVLTWLSIGLGSVSVAAQTDERVELAIGIGGLSPEESKLSRMTRQLGGAVWFKERWGIAVLYARTTGDGFTGWRSTLLFDEYVSRGFEYWMSTVRYRAFLNNRVELTLGLGVQLAGVREERVLKWRLRPVTSPRLREAQRTAQWTGDDLHREPWGPTLALELLIGRKFSQHVSIGAGLISLADVETAGGIHGVMYAGVWF